MLYSTRNLSIIYPLQEITRRFLRSKEFSPFLITGVKNHLFQLTLYYSTKHHGFKHYVPGGVSFSATLRGDLSPDI